MRTQMERSYVEHDSKMQLQMARKQRELDRTVRRKTKGGGLQPRWLRTFPCPLRLPFCTFASSSLSYAPFLLFTSSMVVAQTLEREITALKEKIEEEARAHAEIQDFLKRATDSLTQKVC